MAKYLLFGDCSLTITSAKDSVHNPGSLHPKGLAIDFRTIDMVPNDETRLANIVKQAMDPLGYDTVLEHAPRHLHGEFQPKAGEQLFVRLTANGGSQPQEHQQT